MEPARRPDWGVDPLPEKSITLTIDRRFTEAEMDKIRLGYTPREMEERWFSFFEDSTLYIHRSWTGVCIYAAHFNKLGEIYAVQLSVNRDSTQYLNTDDQHDLNIFASLIQKLINR